MENLAISVLGFGILIIAVIVIAYKWGKANQKKKQAEANLDKKESDEKIDSSVPNVEHPFGGMRPKG